MPGVKKKFRDWGSGVLGFGFKDLRVLYFFNKKKRVQGLGIEGSGFRD